MYLIGILAALLGLVVTGVLVGYGLGVAAGYAWVEIMHTSSFEGGSGMLVFFAAARASGVGRKFSHLAATAAQLLNGGPT